MNIFILNIFLITLYAFVFKFCIKKKSSDKIFVILTTLQLILIQGLRDKMVGTDIMRYYISFIESGQQSFIEVLTNNPQEPSYAILEHFIYRVTGNYQLFLFIISIFSLIIVGQFILKFSTDPYLSYIVYIVFSFYDFGFSGIAQTIAISITLIAFQCLVDKKNFIFVILTAFAATFHFSALIFFVVPILKSLKWKSIYTVIGIVILGLWYYFRIQIGSIIVFLSSYSQYTGYHDVSGSIGTMSIFLLLFVMAGVFLSKKSSGKYQGYNFIMNIMIASLFIQVLSSFSYMFTRLNFYFLIYIIIFVPTVLSLFVDNIKEKKLGIVMISVSKLFLILLLMIYYNQYLTTLPHGILPYYFFWEI